MSQITLLAVTRMLAGVCIGGIGAEGRWVRPVKERGSLLLGDITYPTGEVMRTFDVAEFPVLRPRPQLPHVEDHVSDFIRARPRRVRHLAPEERARFLAEHAETDADKVLCSPRQSLCLARADRIDALFSLDSYTGKYEARLAVDGARELPVTDLRWRALGRRLLGGNGGERRCSDAQLREMLDTRAIYIAYGLSRSFQGQIWPLVVGVHLVPDYPVTIDYKQM